MEALKTALRRPREIEELSGSLGSFDDEFYPQKTVYTGSC
jgi:hypothetical protein